MFPLRIFLLSYIQLIIPFKSIGEIILFINVYFIKDTIDYGELLFIVIVFHYDLTTDRLNLLSRRYNKEFFDLFFLFFEFTDNIFYLRYLLII